MFDLDGTLTNPMEGITNSVKYALNYYGIEENNLEKLCRFIGPPLKESFGKYYNFSEEQMPEVTDKFREYFSDRGIFQNKEYKGMKELLRDLKLNGKVLFVATSKPEVYAKKILERFGMDSYFDFIGGADFAEIRSEKADVIRYVIENVGLDDIEDCVMIGDRRYDIIGGKKENMKTIGILHGFGDREELEAAGADWIVNDVDDLRRLLLG